MKSYHFKVTQEVVWFIAIAILTPLITVAADFDPNTITNWRVWAVGVVAACIRAGGAAILTFIASDGKFTQS